MLFDNLKNYKNLHTTLDKVNWFTAGSAGRKPKATSLPHSRYPISLTTGQFFKSLKIE